MSDQTERDRGSGRSRSWPSTLLRSWLLPGLLVSSVLALAALLFRVGPVEADLADRAAARLAEAGAGWAWVEVAGRDITIHGLAPSVERQAEAVSAVAGTWGLGALIDDTGLIPLASPFAWAVARQGGRLVISGVVPDDERKVSLRRAAATLFPGAAIDDRSDAARGAPEGFEDGARFALRLLTGLEEGTVALAGQAVSVTGTSLDAAHFNGLSEAIAGALPPGFAVVSVDVLPPRADPYSWSLAVTEAGIGVEGHVPDEESRAAIASGIATAFPGRPIDDRTVLASGESVSFLAYVDRALVLATHLATGEVDLVGSGITVTGRARDPDAHQELMAMAAEDGPYGLTTQASAVGPAVAAVYVFEVRRQGNGVALSGFMPSVEARAEVVADAERVFGVGRVDNRLRIADGAPQIDWIGAARFVLAEAARLSAGTASLQAAAFSINGTAASSDAFELLTSDLAATLPASLTVGTVALEPPLANPYRFAASLGPETVTLAGSVPSTEVRSTLRASATARFAPQPVVDETRLASGAPSGFAVAAAAALQAASRLDSGRIEVIGQAVALTGVAPHAGAVARIDEQLRRALPAGYGLTIDLVPKPVESRVDAAECQALLNAELATGGINFAAGSSAISADSEGRLDRLVAVLLRCPEAPVEIEGHTDSEGGATTNLNLSQRRAEAVVAFLTAAGVAGDRLRAVGYGESQPIADNDTPEGRSRNRRIEFTIQEP